MALSACGAGKGRVMPLVPPPLAANYTGGYVRQQSAFTGRVSADASSRFPAEPGRYQLYAALACPWSQRAVIVRRLPGLELVTGAAFVAELYHATDPAYAGWCTLPLLWDTRTGQIVSNDAAQITVMLETAFAGFHRPGSPDLYPAAQRREIEAVSALVFSTVNNGVYKAGLAATQAQYEESFDALFTTMAALEEGLSRRRFLLGTQPTEADVRLYPTLARFDAVYYLHFKCNLRRLVDYQSLWGYARDLFQRPGFGDTTDFGQIKRHYYQSQAWINPSRIVPKGPFVSWLEPHDRDRLSG